MREAELTECWTKWVWFLFLFLPSERRGRSILAQITDADDDDDHDEGTENDVFQGSHDIHGLEDGLIDASNDLS